MLVSTYKVQAKRLGTHLHAKHGIALKHSALLEAVSALHGYSDWNTLSGLNKRVDADRQEEWLEPLVSCKTLRELAICLARERLVSSDLLSAPHLMQSVSEEQKIWEGRALRAWSALVLCLQCRYKFESVWACVNAVYAHLSFDAMFELYRYAQSEAGRDAERWGEYLALMCHYFDALPGFDAEKDNQSLATIDHHNYRVAYLVSLLTPLQQSRLKGGGDVFLLSGKEKEGTPPLVTIAPDDSHFQNSFQRSAAIALAINSHVPKQWLEQIINDRGKIHLVAGNAYSGRTTTLYSTAKALVNRGYSVTHISTIFEYGKLPGVTSIHYDSYEGDPLSFASVIIDTKPDFVITTFDLNKTKDIQAINELCRKEGITFVVEAFGADSQKARDFLTCRLDPNSVLLDSSVLYHQFSLDSNKQPQRDI